jgi:hypothetical protein
MKQVDSFSARGPFSAFAETCFSGEKSDYSSAPVRRPRRAFFLDRGYFPNLENSSNSTEQGRENPRAFGIILCISENIFSANGRLQNKLLDGRLFLGD